MARLNLLPWREQERARKKKDYLLILGAIAIAGIATVLVANMWVGQLTQHQQERNQFLQTEVVKLERQIAEISDIKKKQAKLLKRIDVIQTLQQQRHMPVQVLNELARVVAPGVYVIRLQVTGDRVSIEGFCDSNNHLANMMREVEQAQWLTNPRVQQIVAANDAPRRENAFKLEVTVLPAGDGPVKDFNERALQEISR